MRAWCLAMDYPITGEYQDANESGASVDNRTGLDQAIGHVCKVRGILVVYDVSRLSRDIVDAGTILKRLHRARAELAMLVERVDTSTPVGQLTFNVLVSIAQFQREVNNLRTSTAMRHRQANGQRMGRRDRCPFGMRVDPDDPKKMIEDPEEQETIAIILGRNEAGCGLTAICNFLDIAQRSRRGKTWARGRGTVASIVARYSRESSAAAAD
jgi:DNA invertase Pin-like site-specific DNA recombinase